MVLELPTEVMRKKLLEYGAMEIKLTVHGKENWSPKSRCYLKDNDDLEILQQYNSEIRGFKNYYRIANNSAHAGSFGYIMQYSFFKTLAAKYRSSVRKEMNRHRIGKYFGVKYTTAKDKEKIQLFYKDGFARKPISANPNTDCIPITVMYTSTTSLVDRLKAGKCELCGAEDCKIEIHHVRKLKNLTGKSNWERFMIARKRKTIALCENCHKKLHLGKLD